MLPSLHKFVIKNNSPDCMHKLAVTMSDNWFCRGLPEFGTNFVTDLVRYLEKNRVGEVQGEN